MNYKTLLDDVITNKLSDLKGEKVNTDEYKATVDNVTKLIDRSIEIEKFTFENTNKLARQQIDDEQKRIQEAEERKERLIKYGISAAEIGIPAAITIWGVLVSFTFEEKGTIASPIGRLCLSRLFQKR